ncbi:MAG TPA: hypothetical protein VLA23_00625, partial [Candidatus Limnocylindrales bacterium]|nr:hypothetical protein [Candidatus Limnocylindrales bacterium]
MSNVTSVGFGGIDGGVGSVVDAADGDGIGLAGLATAVGLAAAGLVSSSDGLAEAASDGVGQADAA